MEVGRSSQVRQISRDTGTCVVKVFMNTSAVHQGKDNELLIN